MTVDIFMNILQLVGGVALSIGYIPQVYRTIKTRSADDFSIAYYGFLTFGIALMEIYSVYNLIHGVAVMFFITNTVALSLVVIMLLLVIYFQKIYKKSN